MNIFPRREGLKGFSRSIDAARIEAAVCSWAKLTGEDVLLVRQHELERVVAVAVLLVQRPPDLLVQSLQHHALLLRHLVVVGMDFGCF